MANAMLERHPHWGEGLGDDLGENPGDQAGGAPASWAAPALRTLSPAFTPLPLGAGRALREQPEPPHRSLQPARRDPAPVALANDAALAVLDLLSVALLWVDAGLRLLHANRCARQRLGRSSGGGLLSADGLGGAEGEQTLRRAVGLACRGQWSVHSLSLGGQRSAVVVMPAPRLATPACDAQLGEPQGPAHAVLAFSAAARPSALMLHFFCSAHDLTPAECAVLELLVEGASPDEVAQRQFIAITTVRTHIAAIRAKTGAGNLRELLRQVQSLPPIA